MILVTGADGLVGSYFVAHFPHPEELLTPTEKELDITDAGAVRNYLTVHSPASILHFAAYTNVSKAETEKEICNTINVFGTRNLLDNKTPDCDFYFISSDMVFPGSINDPGPYPEDKIPDSADPLLNFYGHTKAAAEQLVRNSHGSVIRICNPVREKFDYKLDYFRKVLKLYDENKLYPIFDNQFVTISSISDISKALNIILQKQLHGTFHISSPDSGSPFEIYSYLLEKTRGVKNILTAASVDPRRYPQCGGLKVDWTEATLGIKFTPWRLLIDDLAPKLLSPTKSP